MTTRLLREKRITEELSSSRFDSEDYCVQSERDGTESIREWIVASGWGEGPFDLAFLAAGKYNEDCVGYIQERPEAPVIQQALLIAREYGKVVVHGVFEAPVNLELMPMVLKHVQVLGSYGFVPVVVNI